MAERIVFDLDGTLISGTFLTGHRLKSGTVELLDTLSEAGYESILWTTASSRFVAHIFNIFSELPDHIKEWYSRDSLPAVDLETLTSHQRQTWTKQLGRIKVPSLVGSRFLVDDTARYPEVQNLGKLFGFTAIDAASYHRDPDDHWANRVIQAISSGLLHLK
jgi:hypothetical protein